MSFIEYVYNMWFYDILGGAVLDSAFLVHEAALVLTYITIGVLLLIVWKLITWFLGMIIR